MDQLDFEKWSSFFFDHRMALRERRPGPQEGGDWEESLRQAKAWTEWWKAWSLLASGKRLGLADFAKLRQEVFPRGQSHASPVLNTTWSDDSCCQWLDPLALAWVEFNDVRVDKTLGPLLLELSNACAGPEPVAIWRTADKTIPLYLPTLAAVGLLNNDVFQKSVGWSHENNIEPGVRQAMLAANPWFSGADRLWSNSVETGQALEALLASFSATSHKGRMNALVMMTHFEELKPRVRLETLDQFENKLQKLSPPNRSEAQAWLGPFRAACQSQHMEEVLSSVPSRPRGGRL